MIRKGKEEDIERIIEMGLRLTKESSYSNTIMSPERVRTTCETLITHGFFVVAEKDGEVIGAMLGDVYQPWHSFDKIGIDYVLYVEPEHRNGMIAAKMIRNFESWCKSMGAKQVRPGVGTGNPSGIRLYKGLGYQSVGEWFLKNI